LHDGEKKKGPGVWKKNNGNESASARDQKNWTISKVERRTGEKRCSTRIGGIARSGWVRMGENKELSV